MTPASSEVRHEENPHAGSGIGRCACVLRARVRGTPCRRRPEHGERRESVRARLRWSGRGGAEQRQLPRTPRWSRTSRSIRRTRARRRRYWQQDRWNDGGAHGNVAGYSIDGGMTWARARRSSRAARAAPGSATPATTAGDRPVAVLQAERPAARDRARVRQLDCAQRGPCRLLRQRRRDVEHATDRALRQPARGRQQLQRQGDADGRPVQLLARLRDLAADRLAERALRPAGVRQRGQLLLGGVVRALDERRAVVGAGALDLAEPASSRRRSATRSRCCRTAR